MTPHSSTGETPKAAYRLRTLIKELKLILDIARKNIQQAQIKTHRKDNNFLSGIY